MLPEIETLLILQERDQKIRRLKQELARMPQDEAGAKTRLAGDEAAVAAGKAAVMENEVAMKNLDLQIETRKTSISRLKTQQFETRKNEEYTALGHEIVRYGNEVTKLEDDQIVLMEKGELLRQQHAAAVAKLASTQKLVDEELAQIAKRRLNAQEQVVGLESERMQISVKLDETLLDRYTRTLAKKGDAAVVPLDNGVCGGCHMKVTASTATTVKGGRVIANCEQCGRILYRGD